MQKLIESQHMIVIRTNASPSLGVGHLARCRRLGNNLNAKGIKVIFALDYVDEYLRVYLKKFKCISLYSANESIISEKNDALRLSGFFNNKVLSAVIVDDYRFSCIWERLIRQLNCKIIVIDDEAKNSHECDLLIDSTWEGRKTFRRYEDKILNNTVCLLGPKYLLIDEAFGTSKKSKINSLITKKPLKILLSLGGGGDLNFLTYMINHINDKLNENFLFEISAVVGPYAKNIRGLVKLSRKYNNIRLIHNRDGLFDEISTTDLYIGASGGTLFEALALNIPCLTFSISENQKNDSENFEDLGHFFHLNSIDRNDFENFAFLVFEILSQYDRFNGLYQAISSIKIDGKGVNRVSKTIQSIIGEEKVKLDSMPMKNKHTSQVGYYLTEIDDFEVNRYLHARNLKTNLDKMIDSNPISQLNHYIWWFKTNKRTSYILRKNGKDLLYIWHQLKKVGNVDVIISGLFIANQSCNALDVMHAVTEHSIILNKLFAGVTWVIVMKNDNYFMKKVHQRLEFSKVNKGSIVEGVIQKIFPNASNDNFLYYFRKIGNSN
jgi:UDP-2,4-diacetamido-2,4,6-trideoxy-beta-L-altropyranose hydrolase